MTVTLKMNTFALHYEMLITNLNGQMLYFHDERNSLFATIFLNYYER